MELRGNQSRAELRSGGTRSRRYSARRARPSLGLAFLSVGVLALLLPSASPLTAGQTANPMRGPAVAPGIHQPQRTTGAALLASAEATLPSTQGITPEAPRGCAGVHQAAYVEVSPASRAKDQRCAYLQARDSLASAGWVQGGNTPPAFYLYDFVLTYDSSDGYALLFGDPVLSSAAAPPETWIYRNATWSQLDPAHSPYACLSSAMANDPSDGYVVYFAGTQLANGSACPSSGQTWEFHGGDWHRLTPSTSPSARFAASFTNDSADGYLLLFGGISRACASSGNVCGDTWSFSAGSWTQRAVTSAPSNRSSAGMTYDAKDGYVLLFGGEGANGNVYSMLTDTWSFHAGAWSGISTTQDPPEPWPDGLAYDYADGYALYTQLCGNLTNDYRSEVTWKYVGGAWSALSGSCTSDRVPGTPPPQRLGEGITYDGATGKILLFGGGGIYGLPNFQDSWDYVAGNWTNLTSPEFTFLPQNGWAGVVYDGADNVVLLFGGSNDSGLLNQTWEFNGSRWTLLDPRTAPTPRWGAEMAYDASDGYVLLFGGYNSTDVLQNDTWEFVGGSWTELTPRTAPPPGSANGDGMVYDGAEGYVLLYDESTWTFHAGVWTDISATAGPGPATYIAENLADDATDGYVLLFGTSIPAAPYYSNCTWAFESGHWTNLTSSLKGAAPPPRWYASLAGMGPSGGVVLFGGYCPTCSDSTTLDDTWVYANLSWTQDLQPDHPSPRYGAYLVYDDRSGTGLLFGGTNYSGALADAWDWSSGAPTAPYVSMFQATPDPVDAGTATLLEVDASGGTPPLTYSYAGLPPGCASQNASTLTCTPSAGTAGSYSLTVSVTDELGNTSTGSVRLLVDPPPTITAFTADPGYVAIDERTLLAVNVSGGTAPYTYSYSGLPPGCTAQTVPTLPCTPTTEGVYPVVATVADAFGDLARDQITFNVTPLTSHGLTLAAFGADPAATLLGGPTYLDATASATVGSLTYAYWDLPTGCASSNVSSLACNATESGTFTPTVTVSDSVGDSLSVATALTIYPAGAGGSLALTAYGTSPSTIVLGNSTVIFIEVEAADGGLTYTYSDLPPGCASANTSALFCDPIEAGSFLVTVLVNDSDGESAVVHVPLTVDPPGRAPIGPLPDIEGFALSPNSVEVGSMVTATVSVAGGSPSLRFRYSGLPANCPEINASSWGCSPDEAGSYTITVTVNAPGGAGVSASAALTVVLPGPIATKTASAPPAAPSELLLVGAFAVGVVAALIAVGGMRVLNGRKGASSEPPKGPRPQ
jgi:hypothetical protein